MTDNVFDMLATTQRQSASVNTFNAAKGSADDAARAQASAARLGLPPDTVQRNPVQAQREIASQDAQNATPAVQSWLAADPANAAVAHDHIPDLSGIDGLLSVAFGSADRGIASAIRGVGEGSAAMYRLMGDPVSAQAAQAGAAQFLNPVASYFDRKGVERTPTAPSLLQKGAGLAGGIVPYLLSGPLAPITAGAQGVDQVAQDAQAKGASGAGVDTAELGSGAVQTALMALPVGKLAEGLVPTFKNALVTAAARLGIGSAVTAGVVGGGMQLATNAAEKAAVDPNQDLFSGVPQSMATMGLLHAVTAAPGMIGDLAAKADTATATNAAAFNSAVDAVKAAPLSARSPDRTQALMAEMAPGESVHLPAEALRSYFQADGDIGPFISAGVADQIGPAIATGSDVVVPADAYLAHIGPTAAHEALKSDLRLGPDGLSENEQGSFDQAYADLLHEKGDELATTANASAEAAAPMQRVFDEVQSQAREAGFGLDVARQYAALYAARYETRATRLNDGADTPTTDAYQEFQRAGTGSGVALAQEFPQSVRNSFDRIDTVINAVRDQRAGKPDKRPSLLDYVSRNGGLVDDGGEFSAMDADKWNVPKENGGVRGRKPLLSLVGRTAGEMAVKAHEAGYFPDQSEAPDPEGFRQAVRDELAGRKRYTGTPDPRRAEFEDAVSQLDRILAERGVDPAKASNEEIKASLAQEPESGGRAFEQSARGRIDFGDGKAIIKLFEGRDLSTLLHETGHLFLEELKADAERDDAPAQLKADWQTVRDKLGIGDGDIQTGAHETFARSFESYLMDGKAPSEGLRAAFQRFKAWLLSIYKQVAALNVPVAPELRDVFDRLVASDSEIASARDRAGLKLADPKALGMSNAEATEYRATAERATGDARDALLAKLMAQVRRRRTKEYAEQRERAQADAEDAIGATPLGDALGRLTAGKDRVRLDAQAVSDIYGSDSVLSSLPAAVPPVHVRDGGVHPDDLASATGFKSGEGMLNELMRVEMDRRARKTAGDDRGSRRKLIDDETDRLMTERHGDLLNDGTIHEEALAQLHNDSAGQALSAELRALGRKAGQDVTPLKLVERWASDHIADRRYADLQPHLYLRAERKASGEFERALVAGNDAETLAAKQRQMISHVLFREATKARDTSDSIVTGLNRLADRPTLKSMDQDYLDRIHDLLEKYDFKPALQKELRRRASLAKWIDEQKADGQTVHPDVEALAAGAGQHYTGMTVSELQALGDAVDNLAHLGRLKKKLRVAADKRDFEDAVHDALKAADALEDKPHFTGQGDRPGAGLRKFSAAHDKPEFLLERLDGVDAQGKPVLGVWHDVLVEPAQAAANVANRLRSEVGDKLFQLTDEVPQAVRRTWARAVDHTLVDPASRTGETMDLKKANVMGMALNLGNESNRAKLFEGMGWDEAQATDLIMRTLGPEDWKWVQGVWDAIDTLWPHIVKVEREETGLVPEKVEAREVVTPHGTFRGGYYPLVRDYQRSDLPKGLDSDSYDTAAVSQMLNASTPKGHTISRTEASYPLALEPYSVIHNHINKVTTRIAYAEYLRDARKFLKDERIRDAVRRKLGREAYDQFLPWVHRQIGARVLDPRAVDEGAGFLRAVRNHVTVARATVNAVVWLEHGAAFGQSFARIGTRNTVKGVLEQAGMGVSPAAFHDGLRAWFASGGFFGPARDLIYSKSDMMAHRMHGVGRDIQASLEAFQERRTLGAKLEDGTARIGIGKASAALPAVPFARAVIDKPRELAHYPLSAINQYVVAMPTWLGAYRDALRRGLGETEAIAYGDKMVRTTHSSGDAMNLSAIQDPRPSLAGEFQRLATIFYGYHNQQLNLLKNTAHRAGTAQGVGQGLDAAKKAFWLLLSVPLVSAMAKGRIGTDPLDDLEVWGDEAIRNIYGGIVGVRDVGNYLLQLAENSSPAQKLHRRADYSLSPAASAVTDVGQAVVDTTRLGFKAAGHETKEPSSRWVAHLFNAVGTVAGVPGASQLGRSAQYAHDVATGAEHPADTPQMVHDAVLGPEHVRH